jgi:hypothetical protein
MSIVAHVNDRVWVERRPFLIADRTPLAAFGRPKPTIQQPDQVRPMALLIGSWPV